MFAARLLGWRMFLGLGDQLLHCGLFVVCQRRIQLQQLLPRGHRTAGVILRLQADHPQVKQRIGILGVVTERLLELFKGAVGVAFVEQARS